MNSERTEKPKNGTARRRMWWRMGAAFLLGVVITLGVVEMSSWSGARSGGVNGEAVSADILMTATAIIRDATRTAEGYSIQATTFAADPNVDAFILTATAFIQQATQQAGQ